MSKPIKWTEQDRQYGEPWGWSAAGPGWANCGASREVKITEYHTINGKTTWRERREIQTVYAQDSNIVADWFRVAEIAQGKLAQAFTKARGVRGR